MYIVHRQPNPDIPVFVLKKEDGQGRSRTLHRNLLLPITALPIEQEEKPRRILPDTPTTGPRWHLQKTPVRKPQPVKSNDEATSSSGDSLFDYDFAAHVVGPSVQESPVVSIPNIAVPEAGARTDSVVNTQSDNEISDGEENEESGEEPMDREVLPLDHELENRQDSTPESTESNSRQDGVNSNDSSSESNHSLQGADESSQQPRRYNRERHPPARFQSGNFSMLQRASCMESTWKEKAMFLQTLTEGGFFLKASKEVCQAMLQLLTLGTNVSK